MRFAPWIVAGIIAVFCYHTIVISEGTYLGVGPVARLYDWTAKRYDRIKNLRYVYEAYFLGTPLADRVGHVPVPVILDVATGTGRLPLAILPVLSHSARVVGIDRSMGMLREAARSFHDMEYDIILISGDSDALPVRDATCDVVTCLEALEFFVRPEAALREMRRVLRPGGLLLASNRVGWEAALLPGRMARRGELERRLARLGFVDIETCRWQVHYDLVWARAPARLEIPAAG